VRYQNNVTRVGPLVLLLVARTGSVSEAQLACRRAAGSGEHEGSFAKITSLRTR
jgi:hypothetical protein